jgi:hypothetical protein
MKYLGINLENMYNIVMVNLNCQLVYIEKQLGG